MNKLLEEIFWLCRRQILSLSLRGFVLEKQGEVWSIRAVDFAGTEYKITIEEIPNGQIA